MTLNTGAQLLGNVGFRESGYVSYWPKADYD